MLYVDVGENPAQMTDSVEAAQLIVAYRVAQMALELNLLALNKPARSALEGRADITRSEAINAAYDRIMAR